MAVDNPILNNPYEEPKRHYATSPDGELDYLRIEAGRRLFAGSSQSIPVRQGAQRSLLNHNDIAGTSHGDHLVNRLRTELKSWREGGYQGTTRVTRELLTYWFTNEERSFEQSLFFAQREAVETAIYLNEVAEKSNFGQRVLSDLEEARAETAGLPRIAFKMATGTGKTVVMAALIVYHFFNRRQYDNDPRFADNFLLVAPGITIRDRLGALRVDNRGPADAEDYYTQRLLVPPALRRDLQQLNARIAIINFHGLQPRTLQGNKRAPTDGKVGPDGKKQEAKEDPAQVIRRILGRFRPDSRLLVINDEAHHCYLPIVDNRVAEGEDVKVENERAAVWFTGLQEIAKRYKVRSIYDLSATPYYLTGSGHEPYSLFGWVVSDFSLIEAIESGLVKIPYLPVSDDTQVQAPVLRDLYRHVKNDLPRAGQKRQRARAKADGQVLGEEPPRLPETVKVAFKQFYEHYEEEFNSRRHSLAVSGTAQLSMDDQPPVFIVVCNNTSVSKEVFKYIAGYEQPAVDGEPPQVVPGVYDLFSNYEPQTLQPRAKPPTLLIDSDALENSGQIDDEFKRVLGPEVARFKREYARIHGQGAADLITDAEILREVVNTVGKPGTLGAHIRCVVSVSMLTEGWDANTVTHIAGLRAFNSQLLCEQVAGRALRRKSYLLQGYDKVGEPTSDRRRIADYKFPPEYAHIIGVPFKLFKGGKSVPPEPVKTERVHALPDRTEKYELTFPNIEGYRIEYPEGELSYSFAGMDDFEVDASQLPTRTVMGSAIDGSETQMSVEDILEMREQQIIYRITKDLLRDHFVDDEGGIQFHRFHQLSAIVAEWYSTKVRVLHRDQKWKKLLYFWDSKPLVAHVAQAIQPRENIGDGARIYPIPNYYNPTGSSRFVQGQTTRDTYPTRHSHVNRVVIDSGWEGFAAKVLDDLADEHRVKAWVKNAFLDFRIPYTDVKGADRYYVPDFIVRARTPVGADLNLVVEITGMERDKKEKTQAVKNRWLPAVNADSTLTRAGYWRFLEIAHDIKDARNLICAELEA